MALSWIHKFVSGKADGTDVTLVKPSNWNDQHSVTTNSATPVVLGALVAGPITDLPMSTIMPTGVVVPFAGGTAPSGWLLCFGQAISRSTYHALFSTITTTYGAGDGSTTFNLPDMRGQVVAAKSDMGGADAGNLNGGNQLGSQLGVQATSAGVSVSVSGGVSVGVTVSGSLAGSAGGPSAPMQNVPNGVDVGVASSGHVHSVSVSGSMNGSGGGSFSGSGSGGTDGFYVIQPTFVLNYMIKT